MAESPTWHAAERCLYWIDVPAGTVHRHDPASGASREVACGEAIGALVLGDDGALLALGREGRVHVIRDHRLVHTVQLSPALPGYRFNDARVDAHGQVWSGIVRDGSPAQPTTLLSRVERRVQRALGVKRPAVVDPVLALYRLSTPGVLSKRASRIRFSNGIDFNASRTRLYLADTLARCVYAFEHDPRSGELGTRTVFAKLATDDGMPDGLVVDDEDHVWLALWGGGAMLRFDPSGRCVQRVAIPARNVTSMTFGGDDLADLYVTTAQLPNDTLGGHVFRMRPGVRGRAGHATPLARTLGAPRRVLVTGAAGDLGRKLAAHLRATIEHPPVLLDRDPRDVPDVQRVDLSTDPAAWEHHFQGIDTVVHLAGAADPDVSRSHAQRDNVDALRHVLDACVRARVRRVVFASSNFVMAGYRDGAQRLTHVLPPRPINAYGDSKLAGERMCRRYATEHGMSIVCLRIGAVTRDGRGPKSIYDPWFRSMWLSDRDLCQVLTRAIEVHGVGYAVLNAMSDNLPSRWDLAETRRVLGFAPVDGYRPDPLKRVRSSGVARRLRRAIVRTRQ